MAEGFHDHEERFRAVARSLSDAVLVMDAEGEVLFANDEVERLFGYRPEDLVGQPAGMLFADREVPGHMQSLRRLAGEADMASRLERLEVAGLRRDGTPVPLQVTYGMYEKSGERYFTGIVRDLS